MNNFLIFRQQLEKTEDNENKKETSVQDKQVQDKQEEAKPAEKPPKPKR